MRWELRRRRFASRYWLLDFERSVKLRQLNLGLRHHQTNWHHRLGASPAFKAQQMRIVKKGTQSERERSKRTHLRGFGFGEQLRCLNHTSSTVSQPASAIACACLDGGSPRSMFGLPMSTRELATDMGCLLSACHRRSIYGCLPQNCGMKKDSMRSPLTRKYCEQVPLTSSPAHCWIVLSVSVRAVAVSGSPFVIAPRRGGE